MATAEATAATTAHANNRNVTNRKICTIYIPNRLISTAIPRIPTPRSLLFFCARDPANQKHDHEEELIRSDPNRAGAAASRQPPPPFGGQTVDHLNRSFLYHIARRSRRDHSRRTISSDLVYDCDAGGWGRSVDRTNGSAEKWGQT